jgi:catalase
MKLMTCAAALAAGTITAAPMAASAEEAPIAVQIVDALQAHFGVHPGYRANHAKGIVVTGTFRASDAGPELTVSPLFAPGMTLPAVVRFSDSGGMPQVSDTSPLANPHGMAMKFNFADGAETDIVVNALRFFPVSTAEDFRDLQLAAAQSPPGVPKPTKLDRFLQSHPSVELANATLGTPDSFAHEVFYGVNAFVFTNAAGRRQAFRYIVEPTEVVHLAREQLVDLPPDFLLEEIRQRLGRGSVSFRIKAQLAEAGDPTNDATQAWPDSRRVVELGTVTLDRVVTDTDGEQKKLLFLPGRLTVGIQPSDDPLIAARDGAYAVSFGRRSAASQ